jgi:hypothetical protein
VTITYQIDLDHGMIVERWEGFISAEILRQHWQDLYATEDYQAIDRTLILLQEATAGFQAGELLPMVGTLVAPHRRASKRWNAICVSTPEQEYLAGVYIHSCGDAGASKIFRDEASAIAWLTQVS